MRRIICCKFGEKYTEWHIDNLKYMIDKYSGIEYDDFQVVDKDLFGNWFNKFQMYDWFKDGQNLYFDLDMIIFGKLPNLYRNSFTLLDDKWWRKPAHTPLNSSIVSWTGDVSFIWEKFNSNKDVFLKKYYRGSDEFYFKELPYYATYERVCPSIKKYLYEKPEFHNVVTCGQMQHVLEKGWTGWWSDYLLRK